MRQLLSVAAFACLAPFGPLAAQAQREQSADPALRRCALPIDTTQRELQALRCAEWYIARQGYTLKPPVTDSMAILPESYEVAPSVQLALEWRHGTLEPQAYGICVDDRNPEVNTQVYTVAFRSTDRQSVRAVTMDRTFGALVVQHLNLNPEILRSKTYGCHLVAQPETR